MLSMEKSLNPLENWNMYSFFRYPWTWRNVEFYVSGTKYDTTKWHGMKAPGKFESNFR